MALQLSENINLGLLPKSVAVHVRQLDVVPAVSGHVIPSVVATIKSLSALKELAFFVDLTDCEPLWALPSPLHVGVTRLTFSSEEALSQSHLAVIFKLFPGVELIDLHFNVDEDDQGFVYRDDPAHCNIGPLVNDSELVFTWHDYDHLRVKIGHVHAFLEIREISSLGEQVFNIRSKLRVKGWQLHDLNIRSVITADLQEAARIHLRTHLRALLRCSDNCPQRLRLEFPLYSADAADVADDCKWIDPIFAGLQGSVKTLFLGFLVVRGPPGESDTLASDRAQMALRARRVCVNLLRIFTNNRVFHRMQAIVLDKDHETMDVLLSLELRSWAQRHRVQIYSDDF